MKNKRLAICLVIFVFLVLIIVLGSTIFALNSVSLNMLDGSTEFADRQNEIIDSAEFSYGSNVLFLGKNKYIEKIEKQNPYIKVVNIETSFPNHLIINAVKRVEIFAVKQKDNSYAIIDEEGKVLKVVSSFLNVPSNAIALNGITEFEVITEGDFLPFGERQQNLLSQTIHSFREWKLDYNQLKAKIKSLTLDYERENQLKVEMYGETEIIVKDAGEFNSDKFNLVFSAYDSDEKYRQNCILEVRLANNPETEKYELRVYYNGTGV